MKRLAHYSQYFLRDPALVKHLLSKSTIHKSDIVLDIGAGSGTISSVLARYCKTVISIENEPRMAQKLMQNMATYPNVTVAEHDIMTYDLPAAPYKVFANIPFHLSSAILQKLTDGPHIPQAIYMVVQKQFADKLLPDNTGFTSQLGVTLGPLFSIKIIKQLKKTDFWPHPNVDTVLLEIMPRKSPLLAPSQLPAFKDLVQSCFTSPEAYAALPLQKAGIALSTKPSQLTLSRWLVLFQVIQILGDSSDHSA